MDISSKILEILQKGNDRVILSFGYKSIDKILGGVEKGKIYAIGGFQGGLKTSFLINLLYNWKDTDKEITVVTKDEEGFFLRMLSVFSNYPFSLVKNGNLDEEQKERAKKSVEFNLKLKVFETIEPDRLFFLMSNTPSTDIIMIDDIETFITDKMPIRELLLELRKLLKGKALLFTTKLKEDFKHNNIKSFKYYIEIQDTVDYALTISPDLDPVTFIYIVKSNFNKVFTLDFFRLKSLVIEEQIDNIPEVV